MRKDGFLHHGAVVSLIRFGGLASVFVLHVIIARLLSDSAQYGEYAWGQSLLFLVGGLAALGVPLATSRFVASLSAQNREESIGPVIRQARKFLLVSGAILLVFAMTLALLWQWEGASGGHRRIILFALFLAPAVSFFLLYQALAKARRWPVLAFLPSQVLRPLLSLALALCLWWFAPAALSGANVLLMVGLSVVLVTIGQAIIYHRRERQIVPSYPSLESGEDYTPEKLLRIALPLLLIRMAGLVMEHSSTILLGALAGPVAAGMFFAADRLARLAAIPLTINAAVAQPRLAGAYARKDMHRLQRIATIAAHLALWPTLLIAGVLFVFREPVLRLFGDEFTDAAMVLGILLAANVCSVMTGAVADLLLMSGRQLAASRMLGLAAALHLGISVLLIPVLGAVGAALAGVASACFASIGLMVLVKRDLGIRPTVLAALRRN